MKWRMPPSQKEKERKQKRKQRKERKGKEKAVDPVSPAPLQSKKREVGRKGDGVETDEVTVTAAFAPTEVQARELPSATVCALTSRLPAEASGLDGQDAAGEPGYGEGDHKIESM